MPQFFFFDLLLILSMSSPGALADYHSLHLLSGGKGVRKEKANPRRGAGGGSAKPSPLPHCAGCCRVLQGAAELGCVGAQDSMGCSGTTPVSPTLGIFP